MPELADIYKREKQRIRRRRFGVAAPQTYASDTFTRADSSTSLGTADSGSAWTARAGTWGITSNTAYSVTSANSDTATVALPGPAGNVSASFTTDAINTHANGLTLRWVDANNRLAVTFFSGTWSVFTVVAGVGNTRASGTMAAATPSVGGTGAQSFTGAATIVNNVVTVFVNGTNLGSYTLVAGEISAFAASANAGLFLSFVSGTNTACTIDNFMATA